MTPEALARVQRRMDSCGAHKQFSEHCSDCAHVRALEAALAALTPAPKCVGMEDCAEPPRYCENCKNHGIITAMALANVATPPPPEPEGETHTETIRRLEGELDTLRGAYDDMRFMGHPDVLALKQRAEAAEGRVRELYEVVEAEFRYEDDHDVSRCRECYERWDTHSTICQVGRVLLPTPATGEGEVVKALVALSFGQKGQCWNRYGCHTGEHDALCVLAQAALARARGQG